MSIPDYQTLMLPVLRLASEGETRVPDIAERIAAEFRLTAEDREQLLPSGRQRLLHNRVHWAKFYLGKAGLLDTPRRGRFVTSAIGRALLESVSDHWNRLSFEGAVRCDSVARAHRVDRHAISAIA